MSVTNFFRKWFQVLIMALITPASFVWRDAVPKQGLPLPLTWVLAGLLFGMECYFLWSLLKQKEEFRSFPSALLSFLLVLFSPDDPTYLLIDPVRFLLGVQLAETLLLLVVYLAKGKEKVVWSQAGTSFCMLMISASLYFHFWLI